MIEDTNTDTVDAEVEETVEAGAVPASLTVQDLANIRNIIDVASQRGAFKTEEFTVVGDTYKKLAEFIAAITPAPEEPAEDTEAPAEADAEAAAE